MASSLAQIRLGLARLMAGGALRSNGQACSSTVPVTVRAHTSDGADIRLLLDVQVQGATIPTMELDRLVHAVAVPETRRWVAQHDLAELQRNLAPELTEVGTSVREGLSAAGASLVLVELVAAEHLLASPSADPVHGSQ